MKRLRIVDCGLRKGPAVLLTVALAFCFLATPVASPGQQPGKVYRIGFLGVSTLGYDLDAKNCPREGSPNWQAFMAGLREHGYIRDQNLVIECRYTESREEHAPALAAELVSLKPDLLVAFTTANVRAAKQATSTLPIVMNGVIDPVRRGLVASLAQPGGNVTGLTEQVMEMEGKRLQLLKEAVPTISRVAILGVSGGAPAPLFRRELEAAAQALGVTLQFYAVQDPADLEGTFAAMAKAQTEALFVQVHSFWNVHQQRLIDLVARSRLPAMYHDRAFVTAGGLMTYDVSRPDLWRRLGFYVDKILKGAKPDDLPVEEPTKFDLVVNLKTAKALGLTFPPSLLMRAEVIE